MASGQKIVNAPVGSSFTIKNILNLPDDEPESSSEVGEVQITSIAPSLALQVHDQRPVNFKPCAFCPHNRMILPPNQVCLYNVGTAKPSGKGEMKSPYSKPTRRRRPMRKVKQRPLFSTHQVQTLEKEFNSEKYLTEDKRINLAIELKLTETQVKTWFQNRRTKWRKELRNENPPRVVPDGRWKHSIFAKHFAIAIKDRKLPLYEDLHAYSDPKTRYLA